MPKITVLTRHDCWGDNEPGGRKYIHARFERIDADDLSPRARALAEAISACGTMPLDIVMETSAPYVPPPATDAQKAAFGDKLPPLLRDPGGPARCIVQIHRMRADNTRSTVEYLEINARELSRNHASGTADWYPLGAVAGAGSLYAPEAVTVSPSAQDARTDVYLMRDEVLDRWRAGGQPMGIQAWDTLRQARHLPEPDRYVAGRIPQWLPATADAYLARPREMWPVSRIAEYLGLGGTPATAAGSARKQLFRWGLSATGRAPGRGGESMYDADQVIAAHEHRAGSGWRRGAGKNAERADA